MNSQFTHRGYAVKSDLPHADARQVLDDYLDSRYEIIRELKNNKHNYVSRVNTDTLPNLVIKEPRSRNKRFWERIMTLFRPGETIRMQDSHVKLKGLGFACPEPILAAEFRSLGFVTYSFFLYRYQDGRRPTTKDAPAVSLELQRLHSKGYTRGDPKVQNFLIESGQVYFIDFKLAKHRLFNKHSTRMEYAHFLHTMPEGIEHLSEKERKSIGFRFAIWLRRAISDAKRKKREWRE
ncbi:MAG: lipopolysaccharide core heptose(II) kinase RfaY [Chromatocurvus sp.]